MFDNLLREVEAARRSIDECQVLAEVAFIARQWDSAGRQAIEIGLPRSTAAVCAETAAYAHRKVKQLENAREAG